MATMLIDKPSRLHNLSYLLLGYYLSTVLSYSLELPIEQKVLLITTLGSFIGALVYYIKPIESVMASIIRLRGNHKVLPVPPNDEFIVEVDKTEVLLSGYLADERTKINGAFFLAIGIITSYSFFISLNLLTVYELTQIVSALLIVIGFYEAYLLLKRKLPLVVSFYTYYNISQYTDLLKKAIQRKDWIEADKIRDKEPALEEEYPDLEVYEKTPVFGICLNCKQVRDRSYCIKCGEKLVKYCTNPNCGTVIISEKDEPYAEYCKYCGHKFEAKT